MLLALHPKADLPVGFLSIPEAAEVLRISKGLRTSSSRLARSR